MSVNWLNDFEKPLTETWIEAVRKSVKDPKELEKLIWNTPNGFDLNPLYRQEDLSKLNISTPSGTLDWDINQLIITDKIIAANQSALSALENGADAIYFKGTQIGSENEVNALLKNIRLDWTKVHFDFDESNVAWLFLYLDYLKTNSYNTSEIVGSVNYDPLSELLVHGNYHYDEKETESIFNSVLQTVVKELPQFKIVNINAHLIRESGGNAVQEIAVALSMFVEYLEWAQNNELDQSIVWNQHQFNLSIGSEYFIELAKFRAFKILFEHIATAYNKKNIRCQLHGINSSRNKTLYDPYNNLVRASCEAMSGAMGGCSAITIKPYDECYRLPDEFSYRLSRNIQILLKEEAKINKVLDPGAGSYYIEEITDKLITSAWNLFLKIQEKGGFVAAIKNKFIQQQVQVVGEKEQSDFIAGKRVLVGTNKYPNKSEVRKTDFTKVIHADISNPDKIAIPLKPVRLAEKIEIERLKLENEQTLQKN